MKKLSVLVGVLLMCAIVMEVQPAMARRSGGGETIKVSKCYYDIPTGQMLIKASSTVTLAHLYAYRPDGTYQGEVQNGGGSRYGGTVMGWIPYDPGTMTIVSSAGASIVVPTTPFQP